MAQFKSRLVIKLESSNFQSVKYPGLATALLTSVSLDSIATTWDIDGLCVGDV
ncbi:hypothetical protein COLO4_00028 [Corchorus olitorius]|uniref:Uncharacterized protein n=1 Tax=Corchorus olitorius TaxID=93759 RepID=A0A1R3L4V1_9ROSI|nr:hypothetical protein COLO4_00028 [Corchorus olitorius]